MRYFPFLLALAFVACDGTVEAPPTSPPVRYLFWGSSNAAILGNQGDGPFNATFAASGLQGDVESTATWGGRGLMQETDEGISCGDFSPHSDGECYDIAVNRTRAALAAAGGSYVVGGVIWHNGVDQNVLDSLFTQEDYDAEFHDLLRAVARDLPGVPLYVIEAGTNYTRESDTTSAVYTRRFREREAAVCASEPNCRMISAMTEEVMAEAQAVCGADSTCVHVNYFEKSEVHWRPRSVEIIMEETGRNLAEIEG
jgi:hypothetical protein